MERISNWLETARGFRKPENRPAITLSYAQSLDGCLSVRRGQRFRLSGQEALRMTHHLRTKHDAILIGVGTVLADNPLLTVRLTPGYDPRPIILDSHLRIPLDSHLLDRKENMPWIACVPNADEEKLARLEERNVRLIQCRTNQRKQVELQDLLEQLAESGIRSIMIEGGAGVITSFIEAGLVDFVVVTIAPIWLGGLQVVGVELPETCRLELVQPHSDWFGKDLVIWGEVKRE